MTKSDAQIAREWASKALDNDLLDEVPIAGYRAAARHILATTTPEPEQPRPQPGEAWLIEYEGKRYEAIYWYSALYAHWSFVYNREGTVSIESHEAAPVSRLVPESTPDHPEFLETEEDYRSAPEGTIVAQDEGKPFVLIYGLWRNPNPWKGGHGDMSGIRRRVIRRGWEA